MHHQAGKVSFFQDKCNLLKVKPALLLHLFSAISQVIIVKNAGHRATLQAVWCSVKSSVFFFSQMHRIYTSGQRILGIYENLQSCFTFL